MTLSIAQSVQHQMLDAITVAIGTSAKICLYDGAIPASVDDALSGNTLLAELLLASPYAQPSANGVLTADTIADGSAIATGSATFYRICDAGGTFLIQGTVGQTSGDAIINTTTLVSGGLVRALAMQIALG